MLGNVAATLEDILAALDAKDANDAGEHGTGTEQAAYLCEFQLIPQLRITRENFYFWGYIDKSALYASNTMPASLQRNTKTSMLPTMLSYHTKFRWWLPITSWR